MAKKRYSLLYAIQFEVVVEIDDTICTDELLHEINNFWSGAEDRLDDSDGDVTLAVLKMLCTMCLRVSTSSFVVPYLTHSHNEEGWPVLDGSWGIKLISVDDFEFEDSEVTVNSVEEVVG